MVRGGSSCTQAELTAFCAERFPGHKRPELVLLVDELPRTSTGKVVRRQLVPLLEGLLLQS